MSGKGIAKEPAAAGANKPAITSNALSAKLLASYGAAAAGQPLLKRLLGGAFYISIGALLIFVFLVVLHYTTTPVFSFGIDDTGFIALPTADAEQQSTAKTSPSVPIAITNLQPYYYTLSFTATIKGPFTATAAPLVALYRSATEVTVPEATTATASSLATLFPDSNLLVYVDPVRNDLRALFQCINNKKAELQNPIQNLPIGKPFRITLVVTCQYVEFYLNGELMQTVVLPDRLKDSTGQFFGPPAIASSTLEVSNVVYWNQILSSRVIRIKGSL